MWRSVGGMGKGVGRGGGKCVEGVGEMRCGGRCGKRSGEVC